MTDDEYIEYLKSDKWKQIAAKRLEIDNHTCQCCGCIGTPNQPLEVHHLSYKFIGREEGRVYQDCVSLCHACHKGIHSIMNRVTTPDGRHGWKDRDDIPKVHVYTLTGQGLAQKEVRKNV